jgi:site-specific DNA-cytosine methylase
VAATSAPPELNHNDVPHVDASCGLTVMSLFDGIGAAKVALDAGGVRVVNYYSSEVDVDATAVLRKQHGESVVHLVDVRGITAAVMQKIKPDLVIGGSPCQDLSRLNQAHGLGLDGVKSSLFFEFVRVLQLAKNANPSVVFVLENVIPEHEHDRDAMTRMLGVTPLRLLAQLVSPCNRDR